LSYLETGISNYRGWKLKPRCEHPAFLQKLIAPIYDRKLCNEEKVIYIDTLYTICVAFKKLKGPFKQRKLRAQLMDFVETDIELRYLTWREEVLTLDIANKARRIISTIVKGLDPDIQTGLFTPRPGPGATNTPTSIDVRFRPHVIYTQLNDTFPYEDWFYSHPWDIITDVRKHPFKLKKDEKPSSRFKFVPKTYGKPRGICIEQLEMQYLQQGVKNALYKTVECHPLTKGYVNFTDQNINGDIAITSSKSRDFATLDMSEASDRVSRDLVGWLFQDNVILRDILIALSTEVIELPDEISFIKDFPSAKFAPMGSALCFPVMALVHFALIKAILAKFVPHKKDIPVYVYGDDIILPSEYVDLVYDYLPCFGMKLNEKKSYSRSHFRESCGKHAFNGVDITPVYIKCTPKPNMSLNDLVHCLEYEAQLFKKGFSWTARLFRQLIIRWMPEDVKLLPSVNPKSRVLGFIRDTCTLSTAKRYCRRRFDEDLQCFCYKVCHLSLKRESLPPIAQDEGYLRWMLTGADIEDVVIHDELDPLFVIVKRGHVKGSPISTKLKWSWLPESSLF
jgi:hypothetical protein